MFARRIPFMTVNKILNLLYVTSFKETNNELPGFSEKRRVT